MRVCVSEAGWRAGCEMVGRRVNVMVVVVVRGVADLNDQRRDAAATARPAREKMPAAPGGLLAPAPRPSGAGARLRHRL